MAPGGRKAAQAGSARAAEPTPRRRPGSAGRQGFVLRLVEGAQVGLEHAFEQQATIGRTEENDIVLVEPGLSRRHLRIYDSHGAYVLEDLGSANGTRLNGERIVDPEVLREGDHVTVGQSTFRFSLITPPVGDPTQQVRFTGSQLRRLDVSSVRKAGAPRGWWRGPRARWVLLALGLIALGLGGRALLRRGGVLQGSDLSDVPVTYSDDEAFFRSVFGHGETDQAHRSRLIVHFRHLAGRVTLEYGAWGVDRPGELVIELNGQRVGEVPLTLTRWTYGLKLVLPAALLKRGETNVLVFRNTRAPAGDEAWELCFLQLRQEVLPPPDPAQARRLFELGRQAWNERDIEPSNMSTALTRFRRARDLLESLPDRPAIYLEALDYIDKVDRALTVRFQEGLFSAQRAMRVQGDRAAARAMIAHTLRHFAKDDYRHRELTRLLDALGEE